MLRGYLSGPMGFLICAVLSPLGRAHRPPLKGLSVSRLCMYVPRDELVGPEKDASSFGTAKRSRAVRGGTPEMQQGGNGKRVKVRVVVTPCPCVARNHQHEELRSLSRASHDLLMVVLPRTRHMCDQNCPLQVDSIYCSGSVLEAS